MKLSKQPLGFFLGAFLGINLCLFPLSAPAIGMIRAVPPPLSSSFLLIQQNHADLDVYTGPPPPHFKRAIIRPNPFDYPTPSCVGTADQVTPGSQPPCHVYKLWTEAGDGITTTFHAELPSEYFHLDDTTVIDCTKHGEHVRCKGRDVRARGRGREGDPCQMLNDEGGFGFDCADGFTCAHRPDPPDAMACIRCPDFQTQAGRRACR